MEEVLSGVFHWTVLHPRIGIPVSSYYLEEESVLIDPFVPPEGLDCFREAPRHVLLTNRHHYRDSKKFVDRFGCAVHCVESGLHEFTQGEKIQPFRFGDELTGGIRAVEIGVLCPDETALHIPRDGPEGDGMVALADGVIRDGNGPLSFVPDGFMGEDPEGIKSGLRHAYRDLLDHDFDHLLLAHGMPWIGGAKQALADFVG
ncbi:MAG: hypothetical protein ACE5F1_02870 [Planctomycetota bacterium]